MTEVKCTFEQFSKFYTCYREQVDDSRKYIEQIPSDMKMFVTDNGYINPNLKALDELVSIFIGNPELEELLYWNIFEQTDEEQFIYVGEEKIPVSSVEGFLGFVKTEYFEG